MFEVPPYLLEAPDRDDGRDDAPDGRLEAPLERGAAEGGREERLELGDLILGELRRELDGALTLGELRRVEGALIPELERDPELGREGFDILGVEGLLPLVDDGRLTVVGGRLTVFDRLRLGLDCGDLGTTTGRLETVDPDGRPEVVVDGVEGDLSTAGGLNVDRERLLVDGEVEPRD